MKRFVLFVVLAAGCFPSPQPQQPSPQPAPTDMMAAGCQQNVQNMLAAWCNTPPSPLPSGWAETVRRNADGQVKGGCAPAIVAPLEQCATRLEAVAAAQDPEAKSRREAAKPKAESTRQEVAFKKLVDDWFAALDAMKIVCRNRKVSPSHERECGRMEEDFKGVEDRLRAFLQAKGFDMRDVGELGLWPHDPDYLRG